jgi:hypothetical protein
MSQMSVPQEITSLDSSENIIINNKSYSILLSSENKIVKTISDITPYYNLSNYVKIFIDDIKDADNVVIIPSFVDEESLNIIIEFIEVYSKSNQYKFNEVTNEFKIEISKPVRNEDKLREQIGIENYNYIKSHIFSRRIFKKILNAAMCIDVPILIEMICAKIAIDIKYLTKIEIDNYFS